MEIELFSERKLFHPVYCYRAKILGGSFTKFTEAIEEVPYHTQAM